MGSWKISIFTWAKHNSVSETGTPSPPHPVWPTTIDQPSCMGKASSDSVNILQEG